MNTRSSRSPKAGRPPENAALPSQRRIAKVAVRRGDTMMQSDRPRRSEPRIAPPKSAERQHARPGSGIKRSRAVMQPKPR